MDCQEAIDHLYEFLDGELDAITEESVRAHIEACTCCNPHFNFERVFLEHIRERGRRGQRNERLKARIRNVLAALDD